MTALYEIVPFGAKEDVRGVDPLKYQTTKISPEAFRSKEMLTVKLRAQALDLAKGARGKDAFGYRAEFINLVEIASLIRDLKK